MSKHVKRSGLYVLPFLVVGTMLLGVRFFAQAEVGPANQVALEDNGTLHPRLEIGPVPGLTTRWHAAPAETAIPVGGTVQFRQPAPSDALVIWTGANEVERDESASTAECPLQEVGTEVVRVRVIAPGGESWRNRAVLDVVEVSVDEIVVTPIAPSVAPVDLDENSTNEETMYYFFSFRSIAALRQVAEDQYRTSVDRRVNMTVEVDPPGFGPLIEWRFDGDPAHLGVESVREFGDVGVHATSAGPPGNPQEISIETYKVTITSHQSNQDIVPEGEPVTFEAVTDPPGYEDEISWLSSTKYGTGVPILGEGPTFTVQFDDTWGPWPPDPDVMFQWLGVKADNAKFNQDQKPECVYRVSVVGGENCTAEECRDCNDGDISCGVNCDFPGNCPDRALIVIQCAGGGVCEIGQRVIDCAACPPEGETECFPFGR